MNTAEAQSLIRSGMQLHAAGQLDQAERIYQQALSIVPDDADAVHLLGIIACQRQQFERGREWIMRAISLSPATSSYHNSLGNAYRGLGRLSDAITEYRSATILDRSNLEALNNLGVALDDADQLADALDCFDWLISARNDIPQWHTNRGSVQMNAGQTEAAIASFRRAIELNPHFPLAHVKLSAALLRAGRYTEGWAEAEYRLPGGNTQNPAAADASPRWDGSPLGGRTLLIHSEQGHGDQFQFVRYLPLIEKETGRLIVQCHAGTETLLRSIKCVDEWLPIGQPLPRHDVQAAIMSLPYLLQGKTQSVPNDLPYLQPDSQSIAEWAQRLGPRIDARKRIGLAWSGNPTHSNDRRRSCPPNQFSLLASVAGVEFHRLQMPREVPSPPGLKLIDHTQQLTDFDQTAALIANLDLVISVDTAIAHLAGAMSKPLWVLLPFSAEWRWLEQREDSPWYPTARLFRQESPGDWAGVLQRVRSELERQHTDRTTSSSIPA
jgi:Flp pilus assembly protein TadD